MSSVSRKKKKNPDRKRCFPIEILFKGVETKVDFVSSLHQECQYLGSALFAIFMPHGYRKYRVKEFTKRFLRLRK